MWLLGLKCIGFVLDAGSKDYRHDDVLDYLQSSTGLAQIASARQPVSEVMAWVEPGAWMARVPAV